MAPVKRTFLCMAAAVGVTSLAGAALTWDGSAQLASVLEFQRPVIVENRFIVVPVQLLVLFLSRLTDNLLVLRVVYSALYCAVPLVALLLSWWVVQKKRPELWLWAGFGILAACLPGQMFFISEGIITVELFWPGLLLVLTGIPEPRLQLPLLIFLSAAIFFGHPNAVVLFLVLALTALGMGFKHPAERVKLWALVPLFLSGSFLRYALIPASLENEYYLQTILDFVKASLWGYPILSLGLSYAAGLGLFFIPRRWNRWKDSAWPGTLIRGLVVLSGIVLAAWAISPANWIDELGMRRLALFTNLPFMVLTVLEGVWVQNGPAEAESRPGQGNLRGRVITSLSLIFLLTLSIQSFGWARISYRLMGDLQAAGRACVSTDLIPWLPATPLVHWATPSYALLLQSRTPEKLLLINGSDCNAVGGKQTIQISPWATYPVNSGWFDFSKVSQ